MNKAKNKAKPAARADDFQTVHIFNSYTYF